MDFRGPVQQFSRFEASLKVAFDGRSGAQLAATYANWVEKVETMEKVGKMVGFIRI